MATKLIVVTPNPNFGESIRRSLEETGNYRVFVVNSKAAAIVRADEESCKMAFLDLELGEGWVEEGAQSLRTVIPTIKLFILAQDETPPALDSIRPWTLVRKPFQLPSLLETLAQPVETSANPAATENVEQNFPWLSDVNKAAQHLTRLTLESSAQAALIARDNEVWAYAGQLSQAAAQEIAQTLSRNWDGEKSGDLLRFVRLKSTNAEHMLYATQLTEDMLLGMVFDAETPFSTIRSQASQLANSLGQSDVKEATEKPAWPKNSEFEASPLSSEVDDEDEDGIDTPPIAEILKDIPVPDPKIAGEMRQSRERPADPGETRKSIFSREFSLPVPLKDMMRPEGQQKNAASQQPSTEQLDATLPSKSQPRPQTPVRKPLPGELDERRPHAGKDAGRIVLEPASAGVYHLAYACLLVPRFTSHYLTGDIADRLSEWLPGICVAFGWRLEYLAVRPEYLQWVVNVPPATSPGYVMRVMRQQASDKIFTAIPRLKRENPSGDFWAPGYLIMGGTQPHPPQLVKDYIKQIRQRQGIEKSDR